MLKDLLPNAILEEKLNSLVDEPQQFLALYDSLLIKPVIVKNVFSDFALNFYKVISNCNDAIFNKYFFQGLHILLPQSQVRKQAIKRPENFLLKDFISHHLTFYCPKEFIYALVDLKMINDDLFYQAIENNIHLLQNIENLIDNNNTIRDIISTIINEQFEQTNLKDAINVSHKLHVDISKYKDILIDIYQGGKIKFNDIDTINDLFKTYNTLPQYEVLNNFTNFYQYPFSILSLCSDTRPKIAIYFWNVYQQQLLDFAKKNPVYRMYTTMFSSVIESNNNNSFEIFRRVMASEQLRKILKINDVCDQNDVEELKVKLERAKLALKLEENLSFSTCSLYKNNKV